MNQQQGEVCAVVGAQFGSEGKGAVVAAIASRYDIHVRTGAPNAGHTYYGLGGDKIVARSLPVAAGSTTDTLLVIGAGAYLDLDLLLEEVEDLENRGYIIRGRVLVDSKAALIDPVRHHAFEGGVEGEAHRKIGSTGEGVGPAVMAKVARGTFPTMSAWAKMELVGDDMERVRMLAQQGIAVDDTALVLNSAVDGGMSVLLEGTQGSGLSLVHGPWPYVTSRDTNAAALLMDAGLAPAMLTDCVLVARTFPIRVAGASGPIPNETSWEDLGLEPESTTVTKKTRRVAEFTPETVLRAAMLNRPSGIYLTFLDYLCPEVAGAVEWQKLGQKAHQVIGQFEDDLQIPVLGVGTGPRSISFNTTPTRHDTPRFIGEPERLPLQWPDLEAAYGMRS